MCLGESVSPVQQGRHPWLPMQIGAFLLLPTKLGCCSPLGSTVQIMLILGGVGIPCFHPELMGNVINFWEWDMEVTAGGGCRAQAQARDLAGILEN